LESAHLRVDLFYDPLGLFEGALLTKLEKKDLSFSLSLMLVSCVFGGGVSGSSNRLACRSWIEVSKSSDSTHEFSTYL
jgi:hypothetical protein